MLDDVLTFRHTIRAPSAGASVRRGWYYGPNFREKPYDVRPMAVTIPYAPPLPWHRRKRTQVLILRLVIIAALVCAGAWLFRFAQQLQFLAQQQRWMSYTLPADKVVLAIDTPDSAQLAKLPGYMPAAGGGTALQPPRWTFKRCDLCYPFIHARRIGGQAARLVSIVAMPEYDQGAVRTLELFAYTEIPAGLEPGARPVDPRAAYNVGSGDLLLPLHDSLRIFAGQFDPADESHFSIPCVFDGTRTTIDGWLMPDDTIKLEPRK
jgi:hypothetical protein